MMRIGKTLLAVGMGLLGGLSGNMPAPAQAESVGTPRLEIVAQVKQRPGNIAVSKSGRIFISIHPFDSPQEKVMEVLPDGTTRPYPSPRWAADPGMDGVGLGAVLHLQVVGETLYILDMGLPPLHLPKLVAWDIKANALQRVWYVPTHVTTPQSFLQDFVVTPDQKHIVIADMGQADLMAKADPGLIDMDLTTGLARRLLAGHTSLRPSGQAMVAGGARMMYTREGQTVPLYLGLNPIALDPAGTTVYFAPMGMGNVSKIQLADLLNPSLSSDQLAEKVTYLGKKPPGDGMLADGKENLFLSSVADGAIGVMNNKGKYTTWIRDPLLSWPDGLAFGPDNGIYVTVNQLHLSPPFQGGKEKAKPPYLIVRIMGGRPL